jgi:hypothetical protein
MTARGDRFRQHMQSQYRSYQSEKAHPSKPTPPQDGRDVATTRKPRRVEVEARMMPTVVLF